MTLHRAGVTLLVAWPALGMFAGVLAAAGFVRIGIALLVIAFFVVGIASFALTCPRCGRNIFDKSLRIGSFDIPYWGGLPARECYSCGEKLDSPATPPKTTTTKPVKK